MMRLRASLCALLLACIPAAWADSVSVTTVVDEDNGANPNTPDTGCSLREALHYMELPAVTRLQGYGGCTASATSTSDTIVLPLSSTLNSAVVAYQLKSELVVKTSVTINGTPSTLITSSSGQVIGNDTAIATDTNNYPVIQAAPGSRIFTVTHVTPQAPASTPTTSTPSTNSATASTLTLTDISLKGCGNACADYGGIINVQDVLDLNSVLLFNGAATSAGGALYLGPSASMTVAGADIENNTAPIGGAIDIGYNQISTTNSFSITSALFTGNSATLAATATTSAGAILDIQANSVGHAILNTSTISGNTGTAIHIRPGLTLNNDTIVNNSAGIDFSGTDLSFTTSTIYNTLVAANPVTEDSTTAQDCLNTTTNTGTITTYLYNVFGPASGCTTFNTASSTNVVVSNSGNQQVIGPSCQPDTSVIPNLDPATVALLCPLENNGGFTRTHRPRLPVQAVQQATPAASLASDEALNVLINQGSPLSDSTACVSTDQRGESLRTNSCDIGAMALQAPTTLNLTLYTPLSATVSSASYVQQLGDVKLLPAFACGQVKVTYVAGKTPDGCGSILYAPGRGNAYIDPTTSNVVYTPGSGFYGTDTFTFLVATTLSRFSDDNSDPLTGQFVRVNITIQTQATTVAHSTETHAGAWSELELLVIAGLFVARMRRQRQLV